MNLLRCQVADWTAFLSLSFLCPCTHVTNDSKAASDLCWPLASTYGVFYEWCVDKRRGEAGTSFLRVHGRHSYIFIVFTIITVIIPASVGMTEGVRCATFRRGSSITSLGLTAGSSKRNAVFVFPAYFCAVKNPRTTRGLCGESETKSKSTKTYPFLLNFRFPFAHREDIILFQVFAGSNSVTF